VARRLEELYWATSSEKKFQNLVGEVVTDSTGLGGFKAIAAVAGPKSARAGGLAESEGACSGR
jgi:hypothetical protein